MNLQADPGIPEQYSRQISAGSEALRRVLGQSTDLVRDEWSIKADERGREYVSLRLSDWTGAVEYKFAPEELTHPAHLERRLYRLWGDLLQIRSHVQADDYISGLQPQGAP